MKDHPIITHIHEGHAKPNIFEGSKEEHPKADSCYANSGKAGSTDKD